MTGKSGLVSGAVALVALAAATAFAVTDSVVVSTTCYLGVLVGASIGAWIGATRAPRGRRLVPRLIAAGVSLSALGDVLWTSLDLLGASPDVSGADIAWFAGYFALCAALWVVLTGGHGQGGGRRGNVDLLLDAVTIIVVSMLIFWNFAVDAVTSEDSVSPLVRTVWAMYPVADAVLLGLVVRVLMSRRTRAALGPWFALGVCLWLGANIALLLGPGANAEVAMEAAWMLGPVLIATAAWRRHKVDVHGADSDSPPGLVTQTVIAVGPLLVPPVLELVTDLTGRDDQPGRLLIGTALLLTLAVIRTARLIRSDERGRRELVVARDEALEASRGALEASREALAASQAKSMFLANVSHEIRTPLTTVLATAEILEDTDLDDAQLMLLAKMDRQGQLLKTLVEGILDFSRIEAGELELVSTSFDLHDLIADAADVYVPRADAAGIRFEWDLDPRVPRTVVGDPGRLFQVLTNLLDNALKFTPQGQVTLVVRPARVVDKVGLGDVVEFIVADTGVGIPEEDLGSVFESFTQVDGSMTRHHGGSGLGLAICRDLTELMGGTIAIQSQFGAGSTFVVRIPVHAVRTPTTPGLSLPLAG